MFIICTYLIPIDFIFCILFVIFALTSWSLIPKWRIFKNYIYVNLGISGLIYYIVSIPMSECYGRVYFSFVFYLWVLILSIKVYTDLVQIFQINITRIFLKSSAFAWGIPLFIEICYYIIENNLNDGSYIANVGIETALLIILTINFILYVKVVYYLTKFNALNDKVSRCRKIKMATLTFFVCGAPWMISFLLDYLVSFLEINDVVTSTIFTINALVLSVQNLIFKLCFCFLKSNRKLWSEFFERRRRTRRIDVELSLISKSKPAQVLFQNDFQVTHL